MRTLMVPKCVPAEEYTWMTGFVNVVRPSAISFVLSLMMAFPSNVSKVRHPFSQELWNMPMGPPSLAAATIYPDRSLPPPASPRFHCI